MSADTANSPAVTRSQRVKKGSLDTPVVTIQVRGVGSALVGRIAGVRTEACVYACCKPRYGEAERDV